MLKRSHLIQIKDVFNSMPHGSQRSWWYHRDCSGHSDKAVHRYAIEGSILCTGSIVPVAAGVISLSQILRFDLRIGLSKIFLNIIKTKRPRDLEKYAYMENLCYGS